MKRRRTLGKGTRVLDIQKVVMGWGAVSLVGNCPFCGTKLNMYYCCGVCSVCRNPIKWVAPAGTVINLPD